MKPRQQLLSANRKPELELLPIMPIDCVIACESLSHCSIQLPYSLLHLEELFKNTHSSGGQLMLFRLSYSKGRDSFVLWNGGIASTTTEHIHGNGDAVHAVEIDSNFASILGLKHGQTVQVEPYHQHVAALQVPRSITVEPCTENDWEIIESNAGLVEMLLLNQIRIISKDQLFVLFLDDDANGAVALKCVDVDVTDAVKSESQFNACYLLQDSTEVYVAPKLRKQPVIANGPDRGLFGGRLRCLESAKVGDFEIGLSSGSSSVKNGDSVSITRLGFSKNAAASVGSLDSLTLIVHSDASFDDSCAYFSSNNFKTMGLKSNSFTQITSCPITETKLGKNTKIQFLASKQEHLVPHDDIRLFLNEKLTSIGCIVINDGMVVKICDCDFLVKLKSGSADPCPSYFILNNSGNLRSFMSHLEIDSILSTSLKQFLSYNPIRSGHVYGREAFLKRIEQQIKASLLIFNDQSSERKVTNFICNGERGSGKTEVARHLEYIWSKQLYVQHVNAFEITKSGKPDDIASNITALYEDCVFAAPSMLIIDDFELLLEFALHSAPISECLVRLLDNVRNGNLITLLFCQRPESLDKKFMQRIVIANKFEIPQLNHEERRSVLQKLMKPYEIHEWDDVLERTDGYAPLDLKLLSEKLKHRCSIDEADYVSSNCFNTVFKTFTPSGLLGTRLDRPKLKWSDVGGMFNAKKEILKTVKWPLKYANLYKQAKLKAKSGLLLYGPPGCGKTFIVPAIANECKLNLISVRGPELIDKYIGASEHAIRDIFKRARSAAPCLLFFDEFDSIAPRRGQEFSGVTDRMVNQLLTELDGADELEGVVVIAATSRPEIIDPALLRPGRLDSKIYCPFPVADERRHLLELLGENANILEVKWKEVVSKCEGWTYADLQALITNAKLLSAQSEISDTTDLISTMSLADMHDEMGHEVTITHNELVNEEERLDIERTIKSSFMTTNVGRISHNNLGSGKKKCHAITKKHVKSALASLKPALSKDQLKTYESRYSLFAQGKSEKFGTQTTFM